MIGSSIAIPGQTAAEGASFLPTALSGLKLWLRADLGISLNGSNVSAWADQSGTGNNVTQGTGANQPAYVTNAIGGRPAIQTSGSQNLANALNIVSQPDTVFFVGFAQSITGSTQAAFDGNSAVATSRQVFQVAATTTARDYAGTAVDTDVSAIVGASLANVTLVHTSVFNGASSFFRLNGVLYKSANPNTGNLDAGIVLGMGGPGGGGTWGGYLAEYIVYSGARSAAEIQAVERYLGARYGVLI